MWLQKYLYEVEACGYTALNVRKCRYAVEANNITDISYMSALLIHLRKY